MSKSPSLRRIQADIRELALDPSDRYYAAPCENDMFEWHFTIRGADGTDFEGGVYHGRILLPPEYPFKPPHIVFLTPSGRFETNQKVCLSFSAYHPELWQPAWGIRLILEALISFLPTPADGAIGSLDWSSDERKRLAKASQTFACSTCGCRCIDLLPKLKEKATDGSSNNGTNGSSRFQKEIAELQRMQALNETKKESVTETSSVPEGEQQEGSPALKAEAEIGADTEVVSEIVQEKEAETVPQLDPEPFVPKNESPDAPATTESFPIEVQDETSLWEEEPTIPTQQPSPEPMEETVAEPIPDVDTMDVGDGVFAGPPAPGDPSWMYDPLLNLMLVLLAAICYLLIQKYRDLMEEWQLLQFELAATSSV